MTGWISPECAYEGGRNMYGPHYLENHDACHDLEECHCRCHDEEKP